MDHPSDSLTSPLLASDGFAVRHLGLSDEDRMQMLQVVGSSDLDTLLDETIPESIRERLPLALSEPLPEHRVLGELRSRFDGRVVRRSFIGQGYHSTITPPVIRRNVLENPGWYTAYTPYQPEISQGRLEALLDFQTMICELTGLPLANSSLLDEGTAVAEAVAMARRTATAPGNAVWVDENTHPQTINVLATRMEPLGIELRVGPLATAHPDDCFALVVSQPGSDGEVRAPDLLAGLVATFSSAGALAICAADILSLCLIEPPGHLGFDIAVGSTQRFGVPMAFGGPHAAYMAVRDSLSRTMPGRLVGASADAAGRPALRLALQTREQHIRREKATSNICTSQVLLANVAAMYGVWHGQEGLVRIARHVHRMASVFADSLTAAGVAQIGRPFFDTVRVDGIDASAVAGACRDAGLNIRALGDRSVSVSFDEPTTLDEVERVLAVFGAPLHSSDDDDTRLPAGWLRADEFMQQQVFGAHRTEHEMLRYLRRLADKDLALDRTMIPLGSCTMKLNATTEMEPVSWPEFADLHPLVPDDESTGLRSVVTELEQMLVEITGYDAVSLQPNAGSQGEFAGLLAIRAYHRSRGDGDRDVCLIPSSAHGTNAASAVMAGMRVQVVACDIDGNVDIADLRAKASTAGTALAALMITYPSTHGVFEEAIGEICAVIHDHGGQVYVDGANLNALVATARPGRFGADVSHLNLHKTFCIPHGGGGPGVGPVAVRAHLAPFLPGDPVDPDSPVGPVASSRHGSAGILGIPWVYITMMGARGLLQATADAILSANYVAARLHDAYPVLYRGSRGRVAHECILDVGRVLKGTDLTVDDVAKRLMDHCLHAPTMSFPVANTLMVEPTESESLAEIDRFCEAMLSIRGEIEDVLDGRMAAADSPLRHAPHTVQDVVGAWDRAYGREQAVYPLPRLRSRLYFPPVSRIDAARGDRNVVCTCAPIEAYESALTPVAGT